jgi:hypothetical protein
MRTRLPVRSALFKHDTGGLVVKWVTISESLLLYVFAFLLPPALNNEVGIDNKAPSHSWMELDHEAIGIELKSWFRVYEGSERQQLLTQSIKYCFELLHYVIEWLQ